MNTNNIFKNYITSNYSRFPASFTHGKGAKIYDTEGHEYIDFVSGIAVNTLGHGNELIAKVISEQAKKLIHCSNLYQIKEQGELAQFLTENVLKSPGKCFFCNSGAEANEALIKLARLFAYKKSIKNPEIITFKNSFHGRTMAGISATGQEKVKIGFEPLLPGFKHIEFNHPEILENAISKNTVAFLLEIIQGEGGVNVANSDFLDSLQKICKEKNILLLIDEVQAGLGRAGELCSWKDINPEFQPDAVAWAKGLGGGVPIGACWITDKNYLSDLFSPGTHGCTFGGNPLSTAVALAVLKEISTPEFLLSVKEKSKYFKNKILELNLPVIKSVKGKGLILGLELNADIAECVKKCFQNKLLTVGAAGNVMRLLPPLNVTYEEIDLAAKKLSQSLKN